jgi:hypothetical protein
LGKRVGLVWRAGWIVETRPADLDGLATWVEERVWDFGISVFSSFFQILFKQLLKTFFNQTLLHLFHVFFINYSKDF